MNTRSPTVFFKMITIILACGLLFSFDINNSPSSHSSCDKIYFNTKKKIKKSLSRYFQIINFQKGNVVASIGAANGWFEGAASIYCDSLIFYLEDIDSSCLNNSQLEKVKMTYSKIKGEKISNQFHLILGDEKRTNLPDAQFDKVILNMVFHHLSFKKEILTEVKRILKKDGKLFVLEAILPEIDLKKFSCKYYSNEEPLLKIFEENNFVLTNKEELFPGAGTWSFIFSAKK